MGHDLEDVAAAGAVVGLGVMTGGLADAAIGGTIGVLGEAAAETATGVAETAASTASGALRVLWRRRL